MKNRNKKYNIWNEKYKLINLTAELQKYMYHSSIIK